MTDLQALKFAKAQVETMHGSVTGDPSYNHRVRPIFCTCVHGQCIRAINKLIREQQAINQLIESGKK